MRTLLLSFFIFIISFTQLSAQVWTELGLRVAGGTSWLIDKNIFDDNTYVHDFSGAFSVGLKLGINIRDRHGFILEGLFSNLNQNFDYTFDDANMMRIEGTNQIKWSNLDTYLLYRNYSQGAFSEIGVMNTFIQSVEQLDELANFPILTDVTPNYQNYLSLVLGGGAFVAGSDRFTLMMGIRIHYALTDFISPQGQDPASLQLQDQQFAFPTTFRQDFSGLESDPYADNRITRPLLIQVGFEFNFGVGYFAKTVCGGRVKFIGG